MNTPTQEKTSAPPFHDAETPDIAMLNYVEHLKRNPAHEVPHNLSEWRPLAQLLREKALQCMNAALFETVLTAIEETYPAFKSLRKRQLDGSNGQVQSPNKLPQIKVIKSEILAPPLPEGVEIASNISQGGCPWLDEYTAFSRTWSPEGFEHFHTAAGVWGLSSIAARRVYIPFGPGGEFTPLFLALVAQTTHYTKSTTAMIVKKLLRDIGLSWLLSADQVTPQKLLSNMAGRFPKNYSSLSAEKQEFARKRYAMSGQVAWFYDEMGQLFDGMHVKNGVMVDFKGILRRFDDCDTEVSNDTLTRDVEIIENPYLALLGSMTPADAKPYAGIGAKFWQDGLFARFAFITPPRERSKQERFPDGEMSFPSTLTTPLIAWHKSLGETPLDVQTETDEKGNLVYYPVRGTLPRETCTFGPGVIDAFYTYRGALRDLAFDHSLDDLAGNYGRMPTKALRMAALFASLGNKGHIEIRHWAKGQEIAETLRAGLHELYAQVNEHEVSEADALEKAISKLLTSKQEPMTIREMKQYSRFLRNVPAKEIEAVLEIMEQDGTVDKFHQGKTYTYKQGEKA